MLPLHKLLLPNSKRHCQHKSYVFDIFSFFSRCWKRNFKIECREWQNGNKMIVYLELKSDQSFGMFVYGLFVVEAIPIVKRWMESILSTLTYKHHDARGEGLKNPLWDFVVSSALNVTLWIFCELFSTAHSFNSIKVLCVNANYRENFKVFHLDCSKSISINSKTKNPFIQHNFLSTASSHSSEHRKNFCGLRLLP